MGLGAFDRKGSHRFNVGASPYGGVSDLLCTSVCGEPFVICSSVPVGSSRRRLTDHIKHPTSQVPAKLAPALSFVTATAKQGRDHTGHPRSNSSYRRMDRWR